jgi:hypothetical protein
MAGKASYQIVMLGKVDSRASHIESLLNDRVVDLGLETSVIAIFPETAAGSIDPRLPTIALFFGYDGCDQDDHPLAAKLVEDSSLIVTVVTSLKRLSREIPQNLRHINAIEAAAPDGNFDRIVSLILEGFRLLRRERRLFISYKRDDSQAAANQLYDALDARGFDVFIDTRTVPPGVDFQAELWHRLADSDVVVLIDTPGFRSSRWTVAELTQANATNVQILHVLWPGQSEDAESALSYFHPLDQSDFATFRPSGSPESLGEQAILEICNFAERLRAKAIAARHRYLIDSFCDTARDHGFTPSVQPQRWVSLDLPDGTQLAAVPTIGIPTSNRINEVFEAISASGGGSGGTWVLYDNRGILSSWLDHLGWLDQFLPVKSVGMARTDQAIKELAA